MTVRAMVLLCVLFLFNGCSYFGDRARDFKDSFILNGGGGMILHTQVQITSYFKPSLGYGIYDTAVSVGKTKDRSPEVRSTFFDDKNDFMNIGYFLYDGDMSWSTAKNAERILGFPANKYARKEINDQPWVDRFDVGVGVVLLPGGVQLGVSPGQFVDFILGIFCIDIAGDDTVDEEGDDE